MWSGGGRSASAGGRTEDVSSDVRDGLDERSEEVSIDRSAVVGR